MSWKTIRISILLVVLGVVALDLVLENERLSNWENARRIVIYPVLPQQYAEIMAGRTPLSATEATIPPSLSRTQIGALTAAEIGW